MSIKEILKIKKSCLCFCAGQVVILGVCFLWTGIDCSPLEDSTDKVSSFCPSGWFQAQNFCLARAQGESEKGIAMYCDSFGGIGVKGFCIIRAQRTQGELPGSIPETSLASVPKSLDSRELLLHLLKRPRGYRHLPNEERGAYDDVDLAELFDGTQSEVRSREAGEGEEESVTDSGGEATSQVCPAGWYQHRLLCIYKPLPIEKRCHEMGATEFHGLCIKHADVKTDLKTYSENSKRVCCCAHPSARSNHYAC